MAYSTASLPPNSLLSYVTFSCWDHTAGPLTKGLWASGDVEPPAEAQVKLLTQLVLKSELDRNADSSLVDCNMYHFPSLDVFVTGHLFGARCKSRRARRLYCLSVAVPLAKKSTYLHFHRIAERHLIHRLHIYRVLLHEVPALSKAD